MEVVLSVFFGASFRLRSVFCSGKRLFLRGVFALKFGDGA